VSKRLCYCQYTANRRPLAAFKGPSSKGREEKETEGERKGRANENLREDEGKEEEGMGKEGYALIGECGYASDGGGRGKGKGVEFGLGRAESRHFFHFMRRRSYFFSSPELLNGANVHAIISMDNYNYNHNINLL